MNSNQLFRLSYTTELKQMTLEELVSFIKSKYTIPLSSQLLIFYQNKVIQTQIDLESIPQNELLYIQIQPNSQQPQHTHHQSTFSLFSFTTNTTNSSNSSNETTQTTEMIYADFSDENLHEYLSENSSNYSSSDSAISIGTFDTAEMNFITQTLFSAVPMNRNSITSFSINRNSQNNQNNSNRQNSQHNQNRQNNQNNQNERISRMNYSQPIEITSSGIFRFRQISFGSEILVRIGSQISFDEYMSETIPNTFSYFLHVMNIYLHDPDIIICDETNLFYISDLFTYFSLFSEKKDQFQLINKFMEDISLHFLPFFSLNSCRIDKREILNVFYGYVLQWISLISLHSNFMEKLSVFHSFLIEALNVLREQYDQVLSFFVASIHSEESRRIVDTVHDLLRRMNSVIYNIK